jgi:hypothetical protein
MTYQEPHRIAAMFYIKNGGNKAEVAYIFQVSRATIVV